MSKNSTSSPRPKPRGCKAFLSVKQPLNETVKYTEESLPMRLCEAVEYFGRCIAKMFLVVNGAYSPKGRERVAKGDIFVVYLKKPVLFLKLRSAEASPGSDPVHATVPVTSRSEFALTPLCEEGAKTDEAIRSWEGEYESVTAFYQSRKGQGMPMPAALKVLSGTKDHKRQQVPADTILFNIRQVTQRVGVKKRQGIKGEEYNGTAHCFLEGEDPLYFSTKLFDVKCIPLYFRSVLQLPQPARVYLHPKAEEEERKSLQNLSTVTITEISHGHHVVVRKLLHSGEELGPMFTIPGNADLQVVAVNLNNSNLLDKISDQRCLVRAKSCPDFHSQPDVNVYSDSNEVPRNDRQTGKKDSHKEAFSNEITAELLRRHVYVNVPGAVALVPHPSPDDRTTLSTSHQYYNMIGKTEPVDERDVYVYMDPPAPPQDQKQSLHPGSPPQTLVAALGQHWKYRRSGVASLGNSPVMKRKLPSLPSVCSVTQTHSSLQSRDEEACPTEQQLFHHVARKLSVDWKRFAIYLGFEDTHIQQADREKLFELKAHDVLVAWRKGMGNKPKSWATILTALKQTGLRDLASEIQTHIEGRTLDRLT